MPDTPTNLLARLRAVEEARRRAIPGPAFAAVNTSSVFQDGGSGSCVAHFDTGCYVDSDEKHATASVLAFALSITPAEWSTIIAAVEAIELIENRCRGVVEVAGAAEIGDGRVSARADLAHAILVYIDAARKGTPDAE